MKQLKRGEFFGTHYHKVAYDSLILTDTEYTHNKVDWHYHEQPYFTYLLQGKLFESNKKEAYYLEPGSLLFHNWQDAHYNIKPPVYTRGFHIELNAHWFSNHDISITDFEGSMALQHPLIKSNMNKIFIESKANDSYAAVSIEAFLLDIFTTLKEKNELQTMQKPVWVKTLQEFLREEHADYTLKSLSDTLGIHPVHLSRTFSRYFGMSLGDYIRLQKLNKAFHLLASKQFSMTDICYQCGFYDQSHFITQFKAAYKTTPTQLLKQIS